MVGFRFGLKLDKFGDPNVIIRQKEIVKFY